MVEHLLCKQGVIGSNPIVSINLATPWEFAGGVREGVSRWLRVMILPAGLLSIMENLVCRLELAPVMGAVPVRASCFDR